jgi:hypothetical protein
VPSSNKLARSLGHVELGDHLGTRDVDDAHSILRRHEHVRAVGLDDVALVDTDLSVCSCRRSSAARLRSAAPDAAESSTAIGAAVPAGAPAADARGIPGK